jgi:hypothetical protein
MCPLHWHYHINSSSSSSSSAEGCGGMVILAQAVCACIKHLRRVTSRTTALTLLACYGAHCGDEARCQTLCSYTYNVLLQIVLCMSGSLYVRNAQQNCLLKRSVLL